MMTSYVKSILKFVEKKQVFLSGLLDYSVSQPKSLRDPFFYHNLQFLGCGWKANPFGSLLRLVLTSSLQQKRPLSVQNVHIQVDINFYYKISYIRTIKTVFCISGKKFHDPLEIIHDPSVEKPWTTP